MGFKPNSSAMFEHSVKGGKTAKRGKTISKLRILTFSDIEGSLSFFDRSSSSWPEALQEKSLDRQQHRFGSNCIFLYLLMVSIVLDSVSQVDSSKRSCMIRVSGLGTINVF